MISFHAISSLVGFAPAGSANRSSVVVPTHWLDWPRGPITLSPGSYGAPS